MSVHESGEVSFENICYKRQEFRRTLTFFHERIHTFERIWSSAGIDDYRHPRLDFLQPHRQSSTISPGEHVVGYRQAYGIFPQDLYCLAGGAGSDDMIAFAFEHGFADAKVCAIVVYDENQRRLVSKRKWLGAEQSCCHVSEAGQ